MNLSSFAVCCVLAATMITLATGGQALAGNTWDGGGANNDWTTVANWNPDGAPVNDGTAAIHMAGILRTIPIVNAPWSIASLSFDAGAGAFIQTGSALTVTGSTGIANGSTAIQKVYNTIILGGPSVHFDAFSGDLVFVDVNTNGNTLTVWGGHNTEIGGVIYGSGGLTKLESGTLTLSGVTGNSFTGTTTVQAGKLVLAKSTGPAIVGSLAITGGTVECAADYQILQGVSASLSISGSGILNVGAYATSCRELIMTGGTVQGTTGSLQVVGSSISSNASATTALIAGTLSLNHASKTFTIADGGAVADMDISGVIKNGDLTKAGPGTLRFSGTAANEYADGTAVSAGTLELAKSAGVMAIVGDLTIDGGTVRLLNSSQMPSSQTTTVNTGGTLDLAGYNQTIGTLLMTGGTASTGAGTLTLGAGSLTSNAAAATATVSGNLDLGGVTRTLSVADGAAAPDLDISAVISNGGVTKTGPGTLKFSGAAANAYTGTTTVNEGVLELGKSVLNGAIKGSLVIGDGTGGAGADVVRLKAPNQIDIASAVSIANSGLLDLNNYGTSVGPLAMTGGAITTGTGTLYLNGHVTGNADASTATISGKVALQGLLHNFTIADGAPAVDMDLSAVLFSGGLIKEGAGTLRLSGSAANTYTGMTTVNDGTLLLGKAFDILAVAGNLTINSNGTVRLEADQQIADTAAVTISGGALDLGGRDETINSLTMTAGSVATGAGTLTVNNSITTNAASSTAAITGALSTGGTPILLNVADGTTAIDLAISAAVTVPGLTKNGAGTLRLLGASHNIYSGTTTVNAGTLLLAKGVWSPPLRSDLVVGDAVGGAGADIVRSEADNQIGMAYNAVTVNSSGLLDLNGFSDTLPPITLHDGTVTLGGGSPTLGGDVTSIGFSTISGGQLGLGMTNRMFVIHDTAAATLDISAALTDGGVTKNNIGILKFSGTAANTYTGVTIVESGTLLLGKTAGVNAVAGNLFISDTLGIYDADIVRLAASDQISDTSSVTLNWGGLLDLAGYSEAIADLNMTSGHITTGVGVLTLKGNVTGSMSDFVALIAGNLDLNGGERTFFIQDGNAVPDMEISGVIANGALQKNGNGTLRLSGSAANTYTGATTVNQGTLELSKPGGALAIADDLTINNGGTVKLTVSNQIADDQTTTINSGGTLDLGSSGDGIANLILNGGTLTGGLACLLNVWASPAAIEAASGPATISANVNLLEGANGPGTILKTGAFTTLTLGADSAIGGATLEAGTIDTGDAVLTVAGSGTYSQTGGVFDGCLWSRGLFSFTGGTFNGRLVNEGTFSVPAAFTAGNGVLNLSTITRGAGETLTANGDGLDNEGVIILSGGTLAGNGPLTNNAIVSGYGTVGGSGGFANSGLVALGGGSLNLTNSGANSNAGNIDLAPGLQLRLLGEDLANTGTINLGGGAVAGIATLTNNGGGTVTGRGTISAPFANAGGTLRPVGGTINVAQPFANSGLVELAGGAGLSGALMTNSGALQGAGSVANAIVNGGRIEAIGGTLSLGGSLVNGAAGTLAAPAGGRVFVAGGLAANAGIISLDGGTFDNNAAALDNSGQISGRGTLRTGGLTNHGGIGFSGGISDVYGDVTNALGGSITVTGGGMATFYDDVVHNAVASFQVSAGSAVVFFGLSGTGSFSGTGTVYMEGDLRPGASPAEVSFDGDLVLGGASRFVAELAGAAPGSQYDVIDVGGALALGGTLDVDLLYGFQPHAGQTFDLLNFDPANLSGEFAAVDLPDLGGGLSWDTSNLYTTGAIGVVPEPATLALVGLGALALLRKKHSR